MDMYEQSNTFQPLLLTHFRAFSYFLRWSHRINNFAIFNIVTKWHTDKAKCWWCCHKKFGRRNFADKNYWGESNVNSINVTRTNVTKTDVIRTTTVEIILWLWQSKLDSDCTVALLTREIEIVLFLSHYVYKRFIFFIT